MGRETYTANATKAREFRIIQSPDGTKFVFQWCLLEGTISTVTSIKVSREGLLHTLSVIDAVRDQLPTEATRQEGALLSMTGLTTGSSRNN